MINTIIKNYNELELNTKSLSEYIEHSSVFSCFNFQFLMGLHDNYTPLYDNLTLTIPQLRYLQINTIGDLDEILFRYNNDITGIILKYVDEHSKYRDNSDRNCCFPLLTLCDYEAFKRLIWKEFWGIFRTDESIYTEIIKRVIKKHYSYYLRYEGNQIPI